jgi:WD40 repeat protein/transcriptional regulator with XRE-family HTH domain
MATERRPGDPGESFQGLLLRHRGRTGLTQRQLAARVGVSRASVQDWETGLSYPDVKHLKELVVVFLHAGGMTPGAEGSEAETLWAAAIRQARRMQTPFDDAWWEATWSHQTESTRSDRDQRQPGEAFTGASRDRRQDWDEAPNIINFQGRADELTTLRDWVLAELGSMTVVLGIGGIGKTTLVARMAQDVAPSFQRVYWRSLRDALPLAEWLGGAITFVSDKAVRPPEGEPAQRSALLHLLQEFPSLLVLDNFETLLEPGTSYGRYRDGYDGYGRVLQMIGEGRHRSCLVLTSREAPPELAALSGGPVRTLYLAGLRALEARAVLADKHLVGTDEDWTQLTERFGGNGLALKIISESIHELFGGQIGAFLDASEPGMVLGDVQRLLDGQLRRASQLEQHVLRVLAVERQPVTISVLLAELGPRVGRGAVLEAVDSLRRRSLVERTELDAVPALSLQSVVQEHLTNNLVNAVIEEICGQQPSLLVDQPLIKAQANEYLRQTQERLIGQPILQRLEARLGRGGTEQRLLSLLDDWRTRPKVEHGFGPGNAVNLLRLERGDLCGLNLSGLAIRQAYLAGVEAQDTTLVDGLLTQHVLAEAFTHPVSIALTGDGELVAAGTSTGEIYMWRVSDRTRLLGLDAHSGAVHGLAVSADGRLLASGADDGLVRLWDTTSGTPMLTVRADSGPVYDVALPASGQVVVSGAADGAVRFWEVPTGRCLVTTDGHMGAVYGVAVNADGQLFASASEDGSVRIWDSTGHQLRSLTGHAGPAHGVALSADGQLVASGGLDGTVRLWTALDGELLARFDGHASGVWRVSLSPDGKSLASGSWDGTVCLWESETGRPRLLTASQCRVAGVYDVALSDNRRLLANGSEDGTVRLWDITAGRLLATLQGDTGAVRALSMHPNGSLLVSGGFDGTTQLWDPNTREPGATLRGHAGPVCAIALSSDSQLLATAGTDGVILLWDLVTAQQLRSLKGHVGGVYGIAVALGGSLLASGGLDATVRLWDTGSGQSRATLRGHSRPVQAVALSRDGRLVASGSLDGTICLWDALQGRLLATLRQPNGSVLSLALSSDSGLLASGGQDGNVVFWDVPNARVIAELSGHVGPVFSVAMNSDATMLATAGMDATIRLWGVQRRKLLATLRGHTGAVHGVAIDDAGQLLASAGLDGDIRIWDGKRGSQPRILRIERRYERMNITGLTGINTEQHAALVALGAIDVHETTMGGAHRLRSGGAAPP